MSKILKSDNYSSTYSQQYDWVFFSETRCILLTLLHLTPRRRGSPGSISVKFCTAVVGCPRYTTVKKYCRKVQPPLSRCTNVTCRWWQVSRTSSSSGSHFLLERTQQIAYNGDLSSIQPVPFSVPQGSVLGPLLYVLYTAELFHVVARHQLRLHMYADDSQVYISAPANDATAAAARLSAAIADMKASRLRLNPVKTQAPNSSWTRSSSKTSRCCPLS